MALYKRILVALDGSESAEHALPPAVALSRLTHAAIDLIRVHEPSPSAFVTRGRWDEMSQRHELECLRATAVRLTASGAASVSVALVEGAAPAAILREAAQRGADLVVMTDRGRTPSRSKCLGSVSTSVMRGAQVPVLVMRACDCPADLSHGPIFRNVLVAVDDREMNAEVLHQAAELGRLGGGCRLWQAVDETVPTEDPSIAVLRAVVANTFDLIAILSRFGIPHLGIANLAPRVASASRLPIFICPTSRLPVCLSPSAHTRRSINTPSSPWSGGGRVLEIA